MTPRAFQIVNFDASLGSAAQKAILVGSLNDGSATGLKLVFGINNQTAVPLGTDFVFDNLELTVVPEPATLSAVLGVALLDLRRRRQAI